MTEAYLLACGPLGLAPSEFWRMTPGEFWLFVEAKLPAEKRPETMYEKWGALYQMLD